MTFNNDVPITGQSLGQTRVPINTNFSLIDSVFGQNHVAFNASGQGKHKFLQMPEQASGPTTAAGDGGLYTKDASSAPQLFFRNESNGSEYQLTSTADASFATFGATPKGWTFLPGGLIVNYGKITVAGLSGTETFARAYSSAVYSMFLQAQTDTAGKDVLLRNITAPSTTQFQWTLDGTSAQVPVLYYMAIGK